MYESVCGFFLSIKQNLFSNITCSLAHKPALTWALGSKETNGKTTDIATGMRDSW